MIQSWRFQLAEQVHFLNIGCHAQALGWTDIETGITFDTQIVKKYGLNITVETTLDLLLNLFGGKTQLNFGRQVFEAL